MLLLLKYHSDRSCFKCNIKLRKKKKIHKYVPRVPVNMTHASTSVVNIFHREAIRNIISRDVITIYDFIYNIIVSILASLVVGNEKKTSNSTDASVESLNIVSYEDSVFTNFLKSERIVIVFSTLRHPSIFFFTTDDICARCISVFELNGDGSQYYFFYFFFRNIHTNYFY